MAKSLWTLDRYTHACVVSIPSQITQVPSGYYAL